MKFVDIDVSQYGPPPPMPFRGDAPRPHSAPRQDSFGAPPPQYTPSVNSNLGGATSPPPTLPSRGLNAQVPVVVPLSSSAAETPKPKKQPPPKPAKLQKPVVEAEPQPIVPQKPAIGAPNFALEIANRKLKSRENTEELFAANLDISKPVNSEKPAKPAKPAKPIKPAKTFDSEEKLHKALPPPKPQKLALRHDTLKGNGSPEPVIIQPAPVTQLTDTSTRSVPPPPPSRTPRIESAASPTPPPVPPAREYVKPALEPVSSPESLDASEPPKLDLELSTGWYANVNTALNLPRDLHGLNYSTMYQYSTSGGFLTDHTRTMTITLKDLAKVIYEIKWKNNDYDRATSRIVQFTPSPMVTRIPSKQQLLEYSKQFGEHIVAWCLHREGQQVGLGECWDLAHDALQKGCGNHAFVSTYYHHGYPILELRGKSLYRGPEDEIRKGDILQFKLAVLENRATGFRQTAGDPDHTAVVIDKVGDRLLVAEQNVQGVRTVRRGEYTLTHMVDGAVTVYRPIVAEWGV